MHGGKYSNDTIFSVSVTLLNSFPFANKMTQTFSKSLKNNFHDTLKKLCHEYYFLMAF